MLEMNSKVQFLRMQTKGNIAHKKTLTQGNLTSFPTDHSSPLHLLPCRGLKLGRDVCVGFVRACLDED